MKRLISLIRPGGPTASRPGGRERLAVWLAAVLALAVLAIACTTEPMTRTADAGPCESEVARLARSGGNIDATIKACDSLADWLAAVASHPDLFPGSLPLEIAIVQCAAPGMSQHAVCRADELQTAKPAPRALDAPQVAVDPAYQKYWAELQKAERKAKQRQREAERKAKQRQRQAERKAELERRRQEAARRVAQRRARESRTWNRYAALARDLYGDVPYLYGRFRVLAFMAIGETGEERAANFVRWKRQYVGVAKRRIRSHLSWMRSNAAARCFQDAYANDRRLASRWLKALNRSYPEASDSLQKSTRRFVKRLAGYASDCG